jgi:hypothetical protein
MVTVDLRSNPVMTGHGDDRTGSKAKRIRSGDVFQIPIDAERVGYGQIVDNTPPNPPYMAVFGSAYPKDAKPQINQIVQDEIRFLAPSLDAKIYNGDWKVIGNRTPDLSRIPFPPSKVAVGEPNNFYLISYDKKRRRRASPLEVATVPFRSTVAPIRLERALQAAHGVRQWDPDYDRLEYAAIRKQADKLSI